MGVCAQARACVRVKVFQRGHVEAACRNVQEAPLWLRVVTQDGGGAAGKKRRRGEEARLRSRCCLQGLARRYLSSWATGIQEGESVPSDRPGLDERGKVDGVCQ